jgi:hypothetical protein
MEQSYKRERPCLPHVRLHPRYEYRGSSREYYSPEPTSWVVTGPSGTLHRDLPGAEARSRTQGLSVWPRPGANGREHGRAVDAG